MGKGGAIRWSDAQLAEFQARKAKPLEINRITPATPAPLASSMDQFYALGRLAKGKMNKTETAYAQQLAAMKHDGRIIDWKFHAIRIRLADNTFYEPDFMVLGHDRQVTIHEVKGTFTTDKGQLKLKLAAETLPWFRFFKCSKQKDGQFIIQEFNK